MSRKLETRKPAVSLIRAPNRDALPALSDREARLLSAFRRMSAPDQRCLFSLALKREEAMQTQARPRLQLVIGDKS